MKEEDINDALTASRLKIKIVLAFTGQNDLSDSNQSIMNNLLLQLNDPVDLVEYEIFSLKRAYMSLSELMKGSPINAELMLYNWGKVEEPYTAIYGTISGNDIASIWRNYRHRLFSENIRDFLGHSSINSDIINTVINEFKNFFYYNNGITALCNKIERRALGAGDRNSGVFVFENFRVINGAQTVGSSGYALEKYPEEVKQTRVLIKIILLNNDSLDEFGTNITEKTNTQNKIEKRDFVFLDPQQRRLHTELMLEGITYNYKRSGEKPQHDDDKIIDIEEVIVALACANQNVELAVYAKKEIGKLWDDINKGPYTDIINDSITTHKVMRAVMISRAATKILNPKQSNLNGRIKSHYIYGNRLFLHAIFKRIDTSVLMDPKFDFEDFKTTKLNNIILDTIEKIMVLVDTMYKDLLLYHLYRNITKCRELMKQFCGLVN
ncbi:abortive phage infection protein [Candidatus Magnetobacterium bavaricum]|uniref:Abortive phage infection protein n=1 Tax=Candidatus Magnetobacterium bavaricum TaxID=29290 RepID=A0A0F3GNB1_9BACT|nr:abortive phage infection protein [Candidatus Magnetobacterium bavaricum]